MSRINILGTDVKARSLKASAQERVNIYYDILHEPDKDTITAYGTPGCFQLPSGFQPSGIVLSIYFWQKYNSWVVVTNTTLYTLNSEGYPISSVNFTGTNQSLAISAVVADNGSQLCIAFSGDGVACQSAIYNGGTGVLTNITGIFLLSVCFMDSYFIGIEASTANLGQFRISGQYDGLTWNALDFATAESAPDGLVSVAAVKSTLILLGEWTTEYWQASNDPAFPFARVQGSTLNIGCASRKTVSRLGEQIFFLAKNQSGGVFVAALEGFSVNHVSDPQLDYIINKYSNNLKADGFCYTIAGHSFYQANFDTETWLYDVSTSIWSQLKSPGQTKSLLTLGATGFGSKPLVMANLLGRLVFIDAETYTENGVNIERSIVAPYVFDGDGLKNLICNRFRLDTEGGNDLSVYLSISRDGGNTYGNEILRKLRTAPLYGNIAEWRKLGYARQFTFKLRFVGAFKVAVLGAFCDIILLQN